MEENELEFGRVYSEFYGKISHFLERMVGKDEAEDLTQEVFVKVNKGLKQFKGKSKFSTWIYRIATNTALDRLRSRSCRQGSHQPPFSDAEQGSPAEEGGVSVADKGLSAEREAIRDEMNECIREFVGRLAPDYRAVIILSELKELKNQQIADILGVSLDAVKIRLHRARARLKQEFEAGCDFYHDQDGKLACDRKPEEAENGS
jgi:RNA polymerase sigma-70 factor (ECF subfamily)